LAKNAKTPLYSATNRILRGAVNNVRFNICSLKAEADGDLRVGARVESSLSDQGEPIGLFIVSPGGRSREAMNSTPGLIRRPEARDFILSITHFGGAQAASGQSKFCYAHPGTGGSDSSGA
jgi:hypothetical protein